MYASGPMPGYSGTPLIKKLGFKAPMTVVVQRAPEDYRHWLGPLPVGVRIIARTSKPIVAAHIFTTKRAHLAARLARLRKQLIANGFVWISWPKKSSRVPTEVTEDTIRELALPIGLVDIKVCAVSDVWSGLKLVIRKSERR